MGISMEKGGDVKGVFSRLSRGIKAVGDSVKAESGKEFALSEQYGYIHSCPTNLGTGMRASVMIDLPGYTKEGIDALKKRWSCRRNMVCKSKSSPLLLWEHWPPTSHMLC